jgi:hypothetical protein
MGRDYLPLYPAQPLQHWTHLSCSYFGIIGVATWLAPAASTTNVAPAANARNIWCKACCAKMNVENRSPDDPHLLAHHQALAAWPGGAGACPPSGPTRLWPWTTPLATTPT